MPYLEISKKESEEDKKEEITVPNVRELTIKEAKSTLKELGLEVEVNGETEENKIDSEEIVIDQLPKPGIQLLSGSKVTLYID